MAKTRPEEGAQFLRFSGPYWTRFANWEVRARPTRWLNESHLTLNLSDEIQNQLLPSGELRYRNQVAWARFYLAQEGLIDSSKRGIWSLTERGRGVKLSLDQAREIRFRWVRVFQDRRRKAQESDPEPLSDQTVEEAVGQLGGYRQQVLDLMQELPASGFEQLCQAILREAGFVEVTVTGRSRDQGIDGYGTLQVNPLVSFRVLFQCKRYRESVSPSHVRDFRGAMAGRADKGIIITTGTFTAEARRESSRDGVPRIELIDGEKLVNMLEKLELGLQRVTSFKVDDTFFNKFRT